MGKILLVDDNEKDRNFLLGILKDASHEVQDAPDGLQAIELLKKVRPDILLTNIIMPRKSGITLITEVRHKYPKMEIIAFSDGGRLDPTNYLDLSEYLGATLSFQKPIDGSALLMAIDLLLFNRKRVL